MIDHDEPSGEQDAILMGDDDEGADEPLLSGSLEDDDDGDADEPLLREPGSFSRGASQRRRPNQPATPPPSRRPRPGPRISAEHLVNGIGLLHDVPLEVTVEIGRRRMTVGEILALGPSSVVELDKAAGDHLDLLVNGVLVARGEAVVVNDRFGIRLTSLVEAEDGGLPEHIN